MILLKSVALDLKIHLQQQPASGSNGRKAVQVRFLLSVLSSLKPSVNAGFERFSFIIALSLSFCLFLCFFYIRKEIYLLFF